MSSTTSSNTLSATMMTSGQIYSNQSAAMVMRYSAAVMVARPCAIAEHSAITAEAARYRIGEIIIVHDRAERRLVRGAAKRRELLQRGGVSRRDLTDPQQMRVRLEQRLAQRRERVIGQPVSQDVRQRPQDRPIFARVARWERRPRRHLHPAFGVDVDRRFFRIGGAGQHHVGARGAAVAVGAEIDDEGALSDVDLVDA